MLTDARIDRIGLVVADFTRALRFYTRMLGLKPSWQHDAERSAGFSCGDTVLAIQENRTGSTGGGARIYLSVGDVDAERDALIENGVACSQVMTLGGARTVNFSDPDGNRFGLIQDAKS
jgi:catechol 2,3-dioxygenase-like lactoylglutathione lyase family enzyme